MMAIFTETGKGGTEEEKGGEEDLLARMVGKGGSRILWGRRGGQKLRQGLRERRGERVREGGMEGGDRVESGNGRG